MDIIVPYRGDNTQIAKKRGAFMLISEDVEQRLLQLPKPPPEQGGIIGLNEDGVVAYMAVDEGENRIADYESYAPDTAFLNQIISHWADSGVQFAGIFHTHFCGWTLSNVDKSYINTIMMAMPSEIEALYFPLVVPGEHIIVYRADKNGQEVHIVRDEVEIKEDGGENNDKGCH